MAYNILILGAAYGSLLASKMLFGGHKIHHVCLPAEADLINAEGFRVRLPVKGRKDPVEIDSRKLPGKVSASGAAGVKPSDYATFAAAAGLALLMTLAGSLLPTLRAVRVDPLIAIRSE